MALGVDFTLAPERALEFFRAKGLQASFAWQDMLHDEHDRNFTVAKMMDLDLLADVRAHVDRVAAAGGTRRDFINGLRPELMRRGWWGKAEMTDPATGETKLVQLGSVRRLKTIFDTNLRTAYSAGHWAAIEQNAKTAPWVMYSAILDARTRPLHRAWNGTVLRWDHPWWKTHSAPGGWNCRCTAIQLSDRDLKRMGKSGPDEPPPSPERDWTNPRTGEVVRVPVGIDPGWGYAPGASTRLAGITDAAMEKVAAAPAELGAAAFAAMAETLRPPMLAKFSAHVRALVQGKPGQSAVHLIGAIEPEVLAWLETRQGVVLDNAAITVGDAVLTHMLRDSKAARGTALPVEVIERLPEALANRVAVLWDKDDPALVYALAPPRDARLGKLVVRLEYSEKIKEAGGRRRVQLNALRTGGLVEAKTLRDRKRYLPITGEEL